MTETILGSSLNEHYELLHFDTTLNERLEGIGEAGFRKGVRLFEQYREFRKRMERERPDLVLLPLSQTPMGLLKDLRFASIARRVGAKVLLHLHGGELDRTIARSPKILRSFIERWIACSDAAIVLGEGLRRIFHPYLPDERIFTVPNGLNVKLSSSSPPGNGPFKLLFLSNPIRRKGIEDLIEAARILKERSRNVEVDIAGEWFERELETACKERVERLDLPIRFHAPLEGEEKREALGSAHLFILPPREPEGLPVALIEALAHGKPIITTAQGAIPDTTEDGWNGFIVPPEDPSAIADRAEQLMDDPDLRERFGERSRSRYEAAFTEERFIENSYHCFESVLKMPPRG